MKKPLDTFPTPGDIIVTDNGWKGTCVSQDTFVNVYGFKKSRPIIAISYNTADGEVDGYISWECDGICEYDPHYTIKKVIPQSVVINMTTEYCMTDGTPVEILTNTRPHVKGFGEVIAMHRDNGLLYFYDKTGKNSVYPEENQLMSVSDWRRNNTSLLTLKTDDKIYVDDVPAFFSHINGNCVGVFADGRNSFTGEGVKFYLIGGSVKIRAAE